MHLTPNSRVPTNRVLNLIIVTLMSASSFACGDRGEGSSPPPRTAASESSGAQHCTTLVVNHAPSLDEDAPVGVSTTPPVRSAPPVFEDADASAIRLFHDVLSGYGAWTDDARLGLVWIPSRDAIGDAFVPYGTHGRWTHRELALTTNPEQGPRPFHEYIWVSDLPWGWVTFHYGRWAYIGERGWAWVAGRRYAGAWVDFRTVAKHAASSSGEREPVIGWGPTPPTYVWRISPGPRPSRAKWFGPFDPREERLVATPYAAFATPYSYVPTRDFFSPNLGSRLLTANAALAVAYTTEPTALAPSPQQLGFGRERVPSPPTMDRGLQQAWMLATPASAAAVGAGPELGAPPRLRTWVAGGSRYAATQ